MSSSENEGWFWLVAGITLAWSVAVPETLTYHGARMAKLEAKASKSVLDAEVKRAADAYGLQPSLLRALVRVESAYNPRAVSRVGARGIAQIMPFNASRCGLDKDHLWDATYNVRCGAQILREELDRLGNLFDALTVYNCGRTNCAEGKQYAKKVLALSKSSVAVY